MSLLFDHEGKRKYLTLAERTAYLRAAERVPDDVRTFCLVLAYTGARISEVLALTVSRVDLVGGIVVIESLKKRRAGQYRAIPLPVDLLAELERVHQISRAVQANQIEERLWPWCRTTGWKRVVEVMAAAGISGGHATPKGLRHAFAVGALQAGGVPLNMVRKWLGHSRLATTAIYADAMGPEEQTIARRFWNTFS